MEPENLYGLGEEEELKTETEHLLQKRSDEIPESVMSWKPGEESVENVMDFVKYCI